MFADCSETKLNPRACALIFNDHKEILLIRRVKTGRKYFVFPGGSVEFGESREQAVIREVREETSLLVNAPILLLENMSLGRREYYFKFSGISGEIKLGKGPELNRQSATNQYEPTWLSRSEYVNETVLPVEIKSEVAALWESGLLY